MIYLLGTSRLDDGTPVVHVTDFQKPEDDITRDTKAVQMVFDEGDRIFVDGKGVLYVETKENIKVGGDMSMPKMKSQDEPTE